MVSFIEGNVANKYKKTAPTTKLNEFWGQFKKTNGFNL